MKSALDGGVSDRSERRTPCQSATNSRLYRSAEGDSQEFRMFAAALLGMLLIFALDLETGAEIRLHVLYVFPMSIIAFRCGRRWFVVAALASSVVLQTITFFVQALSTLSFITDLAVATASLILTANLATVARNQQRLAMDAAMTDALTQLSNRRAFLSLLNTEIVRQRRYRGTLSLAILDLDGFKEVNDTKGHHAGDDALKLCASVLTSNTRDTDTAARIGGDEFALLMPNTGDVDSDYLCQKLCSTIAQRMARAGFAVTASVGYKTFQFAPDSVSDALRQVDELMYCAKRSGKNRVLSERCPEPGNRICKYESSIQKQSIDPPLQQQKAQRFSGY